jgi:hypothetical protein
MKFRPGIHEDLTYEEYDSIPAYRSHDLTAVTRCPYTWKNKPKMETTPALLEGRVQHTVFLEHDKFGDEFVIIPDVDRRTKQGKEEYEDFLLTVGNRDQITQKLYQTCMDRRKVVEQYVPKETDKVELTCCFTWHGQPFKCRFDWYDGEYVWDLKTCRDASPRGFKQAVNNFNYHLQAALYLDACSSLNLNTKGFRFLAQEKQEPYPYAIYTISSEGLEYARSKNEQALELILECKKSGDYKPYNLNDVQVIELGDLY